MTEARNERRVRLAKYARLLGADIPPSEGFARISMGRDIDAELDASNRDLRITKAAEDHIGTMGQCTQAEGEVVCEDEGCSYCALVVAVDGPFPMSETNHVSQNNPGPGDETPYVPRWCYPNGPRMCPCGHHEGYHNDGGACLLAHKCECSGLPAETPDV